MSRDWRAWHDAYDDPSSDLSQRLLAVRARIASALDGGARTVVSACAGQGRDLLPVLRDRPGVRAVLIEYDAANVAAARAAAEGLDVEVRCADAGVTDSYAGAVPADLVLMCGVFGNVPDAHIERTVRALPMLCAEGATVIWTRTRRPPDVTPDIRRWFGEAGFEEVAFDAPGETTWSVGTHRLAGPPRPLAAGQELFAFVG